MRGDSNDHTPNETESAAPAAYREESNRLILANSFINVAFEAANGTIVSLFHRPTRVEFIDAEEASVEGILWRLEVAGKDGDTIELTNRDAAKFAHTIGKHRHQGELRLWLQWSDFTLGALKVEAVVTAHITFADDSTAILCEAEIELPAGNSPKNFSFPCVGSVSSPDPLADDGVFLPVSGGVYLPNPRAFTSAENAPNWQVSYPGPASMQFFGYCCGDRTTLSLTAQDSTASRKAFFVGAMPASSRLRFWITHYPVLRPDGFWTIGYTSTLGLIDGDWFEASQAYRTWAVEQAWTARGRGGERVLPPLTSAYGLWASHWGGARRTVSAMRELQRLVNVPIKLDWRCWHGCVRDCAYPDYLPPREGEAAYAQAEAQLTDSGVLDQLNISALLASREASLWKGEEAAVYAFQQGDDSAPLARTLGETLAVMCPGTSYWQGKLASLVHTIVAHGADGIFLEDLGTAFAATCQQRNHEHGIPDRTQWITSIRTLLTELRKAIGKGRQLATDSPLEPYLDLIDVSFSDHAAAERAALLPESFSYRFQPIPLFAAVYHDYTTMVGPAVSLVNHRPYDPLWPNAIIAELREPPAIMQRDYQTQFCLEVARSLIWGYAPLLDGFSPEQARDDINRHKLAFLAAVLRAQAWGIGALLPQSQFLGPLSLDCPTLEADLLINPPFSTAASRRSKRRTVPTAYGSAWRVPGGGLALVLVNIHTQPVDFAARLRDSRLNLHLPLRMIGRTFSEDGDVPAASLSASGSQIGGKLPGRGIVLVSLR